MSVHVTPRRTTVKSDGSSLLELQGLTVSYPDSKRPVLRDIDFQLQKGETVLLLGPSGCGKSTLAMVLSGVIPRSVEAEVSGGLRRSGDLETPGSIGYVFQDPDAGFCQFTVADEIAFGLENQQVPHGKMDRLIQSSLQAAGLAVSFGANHAVFSGGMKQKLAVASCLAMNGKLLILDEPTANLDPVSTAAVFNLIPALQQQGRTLVIIEHKFMPLLDRVNRVVLFNRRGEIHRIGPAQEIVQEEWEWLVEEGVMPPWAIRPDSRIHSRKGTPGNAATVEADGAAAVELTGGSLAYGSHTVWQNVHAAVPKGSVTAIVGPNGSGKTSLLQVLAGLRKPTQGQVKLLNRNLRKWSARERFQAVTYCFQNPEYQFAYDRVADELANRRLKDGVPAGIQALLEEFGLDGTEEQSPFQLSQGQKRRLSVAAMIRDPHEVYLLDEPTFGQDARTQLTISTKLRALAQDGKTVVFTTHDMDLVREIADFVIVLAEGGVLFQGSPTDLFAEDDVLRRGHLVDDWKVVSKNPTGLQKNPAGEAAAHPESPLPETNRRRSFFQSLNPAFLLFTTMAAGLLVMFSFNLIHSVEIFGLAALLTMVLGRVSPWRLFKGVLPFLFFYLLYLWSFAAYAKVPPGTPTVNFLWAHLSWYGLHQGEILAMRLLASVMFVLMFLYAVDFPNLMVALSVNLKVPPKFAYGIMAGLRVVPLFQEEWVKLRQARQLRGRGGWAWLRPILYALPLLIQAIRMSERVAIAMEARGFFGPPADSPRGRTYYRDVPVHPRDYIALGTIPLLVLFLLLW